MASRHDVPTEPFPATQWSLVELARQSDHKARDVALSVLLQRYLPALRAHLVAEKRIDPERAQDLLQGFIADKIIEQRLFDHAQQAKGKFRSFLLVTLDRYVVSHHRAETAAKRAPADGLSDLGNAAQQVAGGDDPAESFNLTWARELIDQALRRMRTECDGSQRQDLWTIFHGRVVRPALDGLEPVGYAELVKELGLAAPLDACRLLTTAKRMFARNLRSAASEYADGEAGAVAEIEDLRNILARCGAQSTRRPRN